MHALVHAGSYKIPMRFFTEPEKSIQELPWKHKRPQIVKLIFRRKDITRAIIISGLKITTELCVKDSTVQARK